MCASALKIYPYIGEELRFAKARIDLLREELHSVPLTASLSGMPFGGQVSDSTGRVGGDLEGLDKVRREIARQERRVQELEEIHLTVSAVLRTLTREERMIVCAREMGVHKLPWEVCARRFTPRRSSRWWRYVYLRAVARFS